MPQSTQRADDRCVHRHPLAADNGRDSHDVIGIRGMTHPQKQSRRHSAERGRHHFGMTIKLTEGSSAKVICPHKASGNMKLYPAAVTAELTFFSAEVAKYRAVARHSSRRP